MGIKSRNGGLGAAINFEYKNAGDAADPFRCTCHDSYPAKDATYDAKTGTVTMLEQLKQVGSNTVFMPKDTVITITAIYSTNGPAKMPCGDAPNTLTCTGPAIKDTSASCAGNVCSGVDFGTVSTACCKAATPTTP